jgi:hypothetical protein
MKNVNQFVFVFTILALGIGGNANAQDDTKDVTVSARKCWVASKAKDKDGKTLGYYFKPAGVLTPAKKENPRFCVTSSEVTLVGAQTKGKELWVELSINDDSQGVQFIALNGICQVGYTPAGGKLEVTKIAEKDETVNFDKGKVMLYFADYTALNTAVPKK